MNFNSFAQKVNQSFGQVKQFATEKLGTADPECITELPQEYQQLEYKLDKVHRLYSTFQRLATHFSVRDYDASVTETVKDAVGKFNELIIRPAANQIQSLASPPASNEQTPYAVSPEEQIPRSLAHAMARSASDSALALGEQEPLGAALRKFSHAQDTLGNARLQLEAGVNEKFMQPWVNTLNTNIAFALKAKKNVQACRLNLDAAKVRMKNARPEKLPQIQTEYTKADDELQNAIKDATYKIRLVVDSPEPLRNLADLVNCQLAYFKTGFETLSSLAPEIDELQVTQEALYRSAN